MLSGGTMCLLQRMDFPKWSGLVQGGDFILITVVFFSIFIFLVSFPLFF